MPECCSAYSVLELTLDNVLRMLLSCVGLHHGLQMPPGLITIRRPAEFRNCVTLA